jgi:catechol 2,3-dioxygenase-like lactoylglutathione lyase family enzyme
VDPPNAGYAGRVLQHVSLEVRPDQVEDCVAFWRLLGFEQVAPPPSLTRFTWLERNGTQIHLMPFDDPVTTVRGHAAVVVDDFETAVDTLREKGFETREGSNAWNAPRVFVRDPAGNHVELMSAPPPTRG